MIMNLMKMIIAMMKTRKIEPDELVTETYDEDDETKYMDEDSYNDIMDDYEDMYDKD